MFEGYERQFAVYHQRFVRLATGKDRSELGYGSYSMSPSAAYTRLKVIRADYEERVQQAAAIMPELAMPETWAKPAALGRAVVVANTDHAGTFHQLRIIELSLEIASHQASSAMVINECDANDTLRGLIEVRSRPRPPRSMPESSSPV